MIHIVSAICWGYLSGQGTDFGRLVLYLSDGRSVSVIGPMKNITLGQEILWPWLEGVAVENDFINVVSDLVKNNLGLDNKEVGWLLSVAAARAVALINKQPLFKSLVPTNDFKVLPQPLVNFFCGSRYGDTVLEFDEFLVLPNRHNVLSVAEKIKNLRSIRQKLGEILLDSGLDTDSGSWGGFAPELVSSVRALELLVASIKSSGFTDRDYNLGVVVGAGQLFEAKKHRYIFSLDGCQLQAVDLATLYNDWLAKFDVTYLEDVAAAEDETSWQLLSKDLRGKVLLSGREYFANQESRLRLAIKEKIANTVSVNPASFFGIKEFLEYCQLAKRHNYAIVIDGGADETADDWLADLAVAAGADYLKAGSILRSEFIAKYNRLVAIENYQANN
ncbi:hypothetical protein GW935_04010 [Candidatus Falkowbacteria bacterium]|nr:hypothetical protein [Candidatus Falkowbacteria bacterium]